MGKYLPSKSSNNPRCLPDTKDQVAQTMEGTGLGQRLANAFLRRIAIVKGKR